MKRYNPYFSQFKVRRSYICKDCGDDFYSNSPRVKRCKKCALLIYGPNCLTTFLRDVDERMKKELDKTVKIYTKEEIKKLEEEMKHA